MAPKAEQKIYVGIGLDFETGGLIVGNAPAHK